MRHLISKDSSQAYLACVADVLDRPDYTSSPRGMPIYEILDYVIVIENPTSDAIVTKDAFRNDAISRYTEIERALYDSGTNLARDFAQASPFWTKIQNEDGTINSAYGHLIFRLADQGKPVGLRTPWQWCLDALTSDPDTRQAVLRFNRNEHLYPGNKDVVCTMYGNFHLREGRLHLSMHMRSNDVHYGLVYDLPWFCSLIGKMCTDLKSRGIEAVPGTYTHHADSMHAYARNFDALKRVLGR